MEEGTIFTAKDTYGRVFRYRLVGTAKNGDIALFNLDLGEPTIVDIKWFSQREIKVLEA